MTQTSPPSGDEAIDDQLRKLIVSAGGDNDLLLVTLHRYVLQRERAVWQKAEAIVQAAQDGDDT